MALSNREVGDRHREREAARRREASATSREIGGIPPIANVRRRARCRNSLRLFCETYNPETFSLGWSDDHLRMISRVEEAVRGGALYAVAMPRGSGKSTLSRHAALWALSYSLRRYVFVIGANAEKAEDAIRAIQTYIRFLPLYVDDFPEISHAARKLGGIAQGARGQTCNGVSTLIEWGGDKIVLPTVPPPPYWPKSWPLRRDKMVPSSGGVVAASGLTGDGIRGSLLTLTTGESIRPDLVLIDDPQTSESSHSRTQNATREKLVGADVLGMAAPGKTIAAVMPCTVISPGDFIDRILDRSKHPLWRGERSGILKSMPINLGAWDDYFDVYSRCAQKEPPDFTESNEYYVANRAVLEEGAAASWPERKLPDEVSAVQSAMHLYFRDKRAFYSEYMNQPQPEEILGAIRDLDAAQISSKLNRTPRGVVPPDCTRVTAFIDVGESVLFWCVCGWNESFGGSVVDYGTFPRQNRAYFAKADARPSLSDVFPDYPLDARIDAGLKVVVDSAVSKAYPRQDAAGDVRVGICMIDTGHKPKIVYDFCRMHALRPILMPYRGYGVTAGREPMANWPVRPGEPKRPGWNWRKRPSTEGGYGTHVIADVNHWKTFAAERLLSPPGSACLHLFGDRAGEHQLFADHLVSEYRVRTEGRGRTVDEWQAKPEHWDNDYFDCLVGCTVGASVLGLTWSAAGAMGDPPKPKEPRKRVSLREKFFAKNGGKQ